MDENNKQQIDLLPSRTYLLFSFLLLVLVIPYTSFQGVSNWSLPISQKQTLQKRSLPRLHMIVRGYAGDSDRIFKMLLPSIEAFYVFQETNTFSFVFDDESASDHLLGNRVLNWSEQRGFPIAVQYAKPPSAAILSASPYKSDSGTRIAGPGYTRQLYDTFWFDTYAPDDANETDVIGILDPDAPFIAPFVLSTLFNVTEHSIIKVPVCGQDIWPGDKMFLGSLTPHNHMGTGAMPQLFYIQTFQKLRMHIIETWSVDNFDDAWLSVFGQVSRGHELDLSLHLSPANVLANYALLYDSGYSALSTEDTVAVPIFASNKGNPNRAINGCCRSFQLSFCSPEQKNDWVHVSQTGCSQWSSSARNVTSNEVYLEINKMIDSIPSKRKQLMIESCLNVESMIAQWSRLYRRQ
jgi:hypothetical protein